MGKLVLWMVVWGVVSLAVGLALGRVEQSLRKRPRAAEGRRQAE